MSFIQNLQGIRVWPSRALQNSRLFSKGARSWPQGYAFGGWIYDANVNLGFSKSPTDITLNIVLENDKSINKQQEFDISDAMLQASMMTVDVHGRHDRSASSFAQETLLGHFYNIKLHGITFQRMYLYDYSISVEANQKTLAVTFKDYSIVLNKIYIGLMQRQGPHYRLRMSKGKTNPCGSTLSQLFIRKAKTKVSMEALCPNCYLTGEGFGGPKSRGFKNPGLSKGYGSQLNSFFFHAKGSLTRDLQVGSFVGRVEPRGARKAGGLINRGSMYDNIVKIQNTLEYKADHKCWKATRAAYITAGGATGWETTVPVSTTCPGGAHEGFNPTNINHYTFAGEFAPRDFWADLYAKVSRGVYFGPGFTIDGGYLMLGTTEFEEKTCGAAPNVSYNFTELLLSLRARGIAIYNYPGGPANGLPDKNPRFRANYIGTLREVLEQWCGVFSLDFFYMDNGKQPAGFYFMDLNKGADIAGIRDVADPTTSIGREFGATQLQKSVIVSYKESSTLENTYIQKAITANIKPYTVTERKKSVKRYVSLLPLHPLDFSMPQWSSFGRNSVLGEGFTSHKYANFIPWSRYAGRMGDTDAAYEDDPWHDHRRRVKRRTNRQLWDMDISIALSRLGQDLRDLYISQRICEVAMSEVSPVKTYQAGHVSPGTNAGYGADNIGEVIYYKTLANGKAGAELTEAEIKADVPGQYKRLGQDVADDHPAFRPNATEQADRKALLDALGFEELLEIEDYKCKENIIDVLMAKQEIEDVSMDASSYKMFIGYHYPELHDQHVKWEQACAEAMYGFGTIVEGTIPAEPFIPRDYYGVMDGNLGFRACDEGVSIPKLMNEFEPHADQYPIINLEEGARPKYSLEAFNAPFNNILIESGNYLPTGLYISKLDNPWGNTKEDYEKAFWRKFHDNACTEFNDSLNMVQTAGFATMPMSDAQGNPIKNAAGKVQTKKMDDPFPFKKQNWSLKMFAPKFFKDTDQIFDAIDGVIQSLADEKPSRMVDEISINRRTIDYGEQRFCKKITVMVIADTRRVHGTVKHPNLEFSAKYASFGAVNYNARQQRALWEIGEFKRHQKDDIRSRCDRDVLYEFCEDAIQAKDEDPASPTFGDYLTNDPQFDKRAKWGQVSRENCAVDPTGVYKEGFAREVIGGYPVPAAGGGTKIHRGRPNSRILQLKITRNPDRKGYVPTSDLGFYHIQDLEEDLDMLSEKTLRYNIVYPINNYQLTDPPTSSRVSPTNNATDCQYYSGIWTANVTIEDRRPEMIEIYGHPPCGINPTAGIRVVNNPIDPDLEAMMDPTSKTFKTKLYDHEGHAIQGIQDYHNFIAHGDVGGLGTNGLDHYSVMIPTKKIDLKLAGSLMNFPIFSRYCDPRYGLQSLSISLSDAGVSTSLSFSDRPPKAPQMEGILNKISPRTM